MASTEIHFGFVVFIPSVLDLKQCVCARDCTSMIYSFPKCANLEIFKSLMISHVNLQVVEFMLQKKNVCLNYIRE